MRAQDVKHEGLKFEEMSADARQTAKDMICAAIEEGCGMGVDEGFRSNGQKRSFRVWLEKFSGYQPC